MNYAKWCAVALVTKVAADTDTQRYQLSGSRDLYTVLWIARRSHARYKNCLFPLETCWESLATPKQWPPGEKLDILHRVIQHFHISVNNFRHVLCRSRHCTFWVFCDQVWLVYFLQVQDLTKLLATSQQRVNSKITTRKKYITEA